jgi:hypothetical protein
VFHTWLPAILFLIKIIWAIFDATIGLVFLTIGVRDVLGFHHQFDDPFTTTWFLFVIGGISLYCGVVLLVVAIIPESEPNFSRIPVTFRRRRWHLGRLQTIEIDRDRVRVRKKGLFATDWEEPLSAFTGVVRRTRMRIFMGLLHLVELVHPDRGKSLRLYDGSEFSGYDKETSYKQWRDTADVLDLPAYDEPTPKWTL